MEIVAILFVMIMGVILEALIYNKRIFPYLHYDCKFSTNEALENEQLEIIETVTNPKKLMIPSLKSEITTSKYLDFAANVSTVNDKTRSLASLFTVGAKQRVTRSWKVNCLRRGIYHIEDTTIIANDLFGYYQYSNLFKVHSQLVVLPSPIYIHSLLRHYKDIQGDYTVKRFILEDPFITSGVREYTAHDSINKIHWNLTARQNELMVRNNEATAKQNLTVIINMQLAKEQPKEYSMDHKLETCIKIAAGELEQTISQSTPVKLMVNAALQGHTESFISQEMWGQAHIHELFEALAYLENKYTVNLSTFLTLNEKLIQTPTVTLITCFIDEDSAFLIREKNSEGIHFKIYLLAYQEDSTPYPDLEIYYLLDILDRK